MEACLIALYSSLTGTVVTLFTPELIIRSLHKVEWWGMAGKGKRRGGQRQKEEGLFSKLKALVIFRSY